MPYERIGDPLAAARVEVEVVPLLLSAGEAGKTETAAPLSTKKRLPVLLSLTEKVFELDELTEEMMKGR